MNLDIWIHAKTKPDGFNYWSYILIYIDDILVVDDDPKFLVDNYYMVLYYTLEP